MSKLAGVSKITIVKRNALDHLGELEAGSVRAVITSPPYWRARDYGTPATKWPPVRYRPMSGLDEIEVPAWVGCLGHEKTPAEYVGHLLAILREVRRVLAEDGTMWLNLGDTYASGKGRCYNPGGGPNSQVARHSELKAAGGYQLHRGNKSELTAVGLKPKDLVGVPWRVAFALQADGWFLRRDLIWAKGISFRPEFSGAAMPESTRDRPSTSHEYVFMLSRSAEYFYNYAATLEPGSSGPSDLKKMTEQKARIGGKHKHLSDPLSKASEATNIGQKRGVGEPGLRNLRSVWVIQHGKGFRGDHSATFPVSLVAPAIVAGTEPGDLVLDPFFGAGTVGIAAAELGRDCLGIDLSAEYCEMALIRLAREVGLLAEVVVR